MLAMLLSVVVALVVLAVAAAVLITVSALPFVTAVDMAERRRFSAARWGGLQLVLLAIAVLVGFVGYRHGHLLLLAVPAVLMCWLAPLILTMLGPADVRIGGYQGVHET